MAPGHVYVYAICSFYQRNLAKQGEETVSTSCLEIKFALVYVCVMYVCIFLRVCCIQELEMYLTTERSKRSKSKP